MIPRRVLAVMDDSDDQSALVSAAALADKHGAALEVLCCVEPPSDVGVIARLAGHAPDEILATVRDARESHCRARLAALLPGRDVPFQVRTGKTFIEIIKHVTERDCDFVVKQAEPLTGMHRMLFASTDQHLLRKCPKPVWLLTPDTAGLPRRVIAAVDVDIADADEPETLTGLNRRVIETARLIAAPSDAQIVALHAWDAMGAGMVWAFSSQAEARVSADAYMNEVLETRRAAMTRLLDGVGNGASDDLTPQLVQGPPEDVIESQCRALQADVVVMGTVARTGLSGVFIGNTAENIINSLECPVVAVKPDGFVSPLVQH